MLATRPFWISSVLLAATLASSLANAICLKPGVNNAGIKCHEDIPGNNESAKLQSCQWAAYAAKQAQNVTCYPEFPGYVKQNLGGVCAAYHVPTSSCETILSLVVPPNVEASSMTINFTIADVWNTAQNIVDSCCRGGNKTLATPNAVGDSGWMVEVTEGFAAS